MSEKITSCPLCKNVKSRYVCRFGEYIYRRCLSCSLVYLSNPPSYTFFEKFYAYESDESLMNEIKKLNPLQSFFLRNSLLLKFVLFGGDLINNNWVKSVNSIGSVGKVLDVGCGPGKFLEGMKEAGWRIQGLEIGEKLVKEASRKVGRKFIFRGNLAKFVAMKPKERFDIITFWHVFEHIGRIGQTLKSVKKTLKEGGILVLEVPHSESLNLKIFGGFWTFLMPPQHLHFWSEKTLRKLLSGYNFSIVKVEYPYYFAFVFLSSLIKKYRLMMFFIPILIFFSPIISFILSFFKKGDVIRVYAKF